MHSHLHIGVVIAVGLFIASSAHAAQVISLTSNELVDRADVIVQGHVVAAVAERPAHAPKRIRTRVTVAIDETLKASAQFRFKGQFEVFVPGGEVGRYGQKVPGAPHLMTGDRVLLHMRFDSRGELQILGLAQGCYHLTLIDNVPHAVRRNRGIHYVRAPKKLGDSHRPVHRADIERIPLDTLLTRIRSRVSLKNK